MKKSVISYGEQFLASESDEVRYRASLLREVLQTTDSFANEVVAIAAHADVKAEIAKMNEERKAMTTLDAEGGGVGRQHQSGRRYRGRGG